MLRAILFDLDGTLADTERQCAESVARALARLGRAITTAERDFVIGHGWNEIHAELVRGGALAVSKAELIALAGRERELLVEEQGLAVLPGAIELVRAAATELAIAVVSGSSRSEIAVSLRSLGIDGLIPRYVGAEDVPRGKPSPEGFLLGARHLGVAPYETVVIEDSNAGVAAGLAAGMTVVAVRAGNFAGQDQSAAHLVVDTLAEVDVARLSVLHAATQLGRQVP